MNRRIEDNDEEETNNQKLKKKQTHDKETRNKVKHGAAGVGATRSSSAMSVK